MNFAGIDIGGANIKFASTSGECKQVAFAFWKDQHRLPSILAELSDSIAMPTCLGVTMTAELADCFDSKCAGVEFIVNSVESTFGQSMPRYYQTDGEMCDAQTAIHNWQSVAASNWHALAWFAFAGFKEQSGFVFDVGSTTTDIIPVENGMPVVGGQNDLDRLANQQLFYAGVGRTPVCSLIERVEFESRSVSIARELFATLADVFLWLEEVEPSDSTHTADGRPATRINAGRRLARMVCADYEELTRRDLDALATQTRNKLTTHLARCLRSVVAQHSSLPLIFKTFGGGAWLADEVVHQAFAGMPDANPKIISYSSDETINQTAAARAVAKKRELIFAQIATKQNAL